MKLLSVCCVCVVVCLMACSRKGLPQAGTITRADSSVVKKDSTWRDVVTDIDTVYLPGDTIKIETLIECDPVTNKPKDISKFSLLNRRLRLIFQDDAIWKDVVIKYKWIGGGIDGTEQEEWNAYRIESGLPYFNTERCQLKCMI